MHCEHKSTVAELLICLTRNINHTISNNCQKQFPTIPRDFILIDFFKLPPSEISFTLTECLLNV